MDGTTTSRAMSDSLRSLDEIRYALDQAEWTTPAQVHGTNFRPHVRERYRQWLVHKLAGWVDQFDVSGCVGCGRCITWCPVGIDITAEVAALRATDGARSEGSGR